MTPTIIPPEFFRCTSQLLHYTEKSVSMCTFLTRNRLHENHVINQKKVPRSFLCMSCFEGQGFKSDTSMRWGGCQSVRGNLSLPAVVVGDGSKSFKCMQKTNTCNTHIQANAHTRTSTPVLICTHTYATRQASNQADTQGVKSKNRASFNE